MQRFISTFILALSAGAMLTGCGVAKTTGKVAALPFKAVYKTGEFATKGVYGTTKLAGKSVYKTGEFTGKTLYNTGKGVYYVGTVPVKITDKALDTTTKALTVTTKMVDLSGKVVEVSRKIQATELEAELAGIRGAANVLEVMVDALS